MKREDVACAVVLRVCTRILRFAKVAKEAELPERYQRPHDAAPQVREKRVCRALRNVRDWWRRHTANCTWAGKHGVRQRGAVRHRHVSQHLLQQPVKKHTNAAKDSSAPLRLYLHSPDVAPRHALHVGERLGGAGKVISERNGRRALAVLAWTSEAALGQFLG